LYFDLDVEFAWASEQLQIRIYGVQPPTPRGVMLTPVIREQTNKAT